MDRTYCHVPTCSAFINPATFEGYLWAVCPLCRSETCADCKAEAHHGPCPRDQTEDMLMQVAERNQWQKCFGCRRIVELKHGCNHITYVFNSPISRDSVSIC